MPLSRPDIRESLIRRFEEFAEMQHEPGAEISNSSWRLIDNVEVEFEGCGFWDDDIEHRWIGESLWDEAEVETVKKGLALFDEIAMKANDIDRDNWIEVFAGSPELPQIQREFAATALKLRQRDEAEGVPRFFWPNDYRLRQSNEPQ